MQVTRKIEAVPAGAEDAALEAAEVGDGEDELAARLEQTVGALQVRARVAHVFQRVEHGDDLPGTIREGRLRKVCSDGTASETRSPGRDIERKGFDTAFAKELGEETAAAAGIENAVRLSDELNMIDQNQPAVDIRRFVFRTGTLEPVALRVESAEIGRLRLGACHAAFCAPDYGEKFVSGPIEHVCAAIERA
jgi:hypothetical protein